MSSIYQRRYKVNNGTDYDEYHFVTDAELVKNSDGTTVSSYMADYASYASAKDDNDIYTIVDFKRKDGTLYLNSTLSNKDSNGNYTNDILKYYDTNGTTLLKTVTWTFTYDTDGNIITKVVA